MTTQASQYISDLQQKFPPWDYDRRGQKIDRARRIYSVLKTRLPLNIEKLRKRNRLVIGEVGRKSPHAYFKPCVDDSYAIVFHTGFMHFLYGTARILAGRTSVHRVGHPPVPSSLSIEETIRRLKVLFEKTRDPNEVLADAGFELHPAQVQVAEKLAIHAEGFILMHEVGHVHFQTANPSSAFDSEEEYADYFAAKVMVREGQGIDVRWAFAGALFALRVHTCLERIGHEFPESYPLPSRRLELLNRAMTDLYPDEGKRESLRRIGTTKDQMMSWSRTC